MNIRALLFLALFNLAFVVITMGHGAGLGVIIPLLPIAAITGHSGLLGSGLAGAALLKLKAAAVVAGLFHLKRGHGHAGFNLNLGHHGEESHGWGWNRKRRSVEINDARGETVDVNMKEYDPSLDEVLQYDQLGCGLRLVCELSAAPQGSLQDDEKLILELFGEDGDVYRESGQQNRFGRDEKAPNPNKASRGKLSYSYAALLGGSARDSNVCTKVYGQCPYNGQQVMESLRAAQV